MLTLAIGVASISFLAIPTLIDRAMQQEVRVGRLADVTITMRPVELTDSQLADLAALTNVAAVEAPFERGRYECWSANDVHRRG